MSKDYAKTRQSRRRSRPVNNTKTGSNFTWLIVGLVMGVIIAGLGFLKHRVTATVHPESKLLLDTQPKKQQNARVAAKQSEPSEDKVNFDFYTILPNMKVAGSNAKSIADKSKAHSFTENNSEINNKGTKSLAKIDLPAPKITPKEVQNVEQHLLSPSQPVKVENHHLKLITTERTKQAPKTVSVEKSQPVAKVGQIGAPVVDLSVDKRSPVKNTAISPTYIVQIAAFQRFEDADRLKAQLSLGGYEAKVRTVPVRGVTWHRVWLGPYADLSAARKIQQELLTKHTKSVVVKASS